MRWTLQAGHLTWAIKETVWVFVVATTCWPLRTIFPCCYVVEWSCPAFVWFCGMMAAIFAPESIWPQNGATKKPRLFHCLAVMLLVLVVAGFLVTAIVSGATLKSQTHLGTGVAKSVPNFAFSWFNIRFGLLSPFTFLVQWESLPLDLKDPQGVIRQILHFWNGAVKIKCETCWTFEKVMPSWLRNLPAEDIRSIDINVCCICAGY